MNNTPLWFTLVTVGITAIATLFTQWLVTFLANRRADSRLRTELKHQREIKQLELLHNSRYELYIQLADVMQEADEASSYFEVPFIADSAADNVKTRLLTARKALQMVRSKFLLVASANATAGFNEYDETLEMLLRGWRQHRSLEDTYWHTLSESQLEMFYATHARFNNLLRNDLGAVEPYTDARHGAIFRRLKKYNLKNFPTKLDKD